jgi:hypothetical protein
MSLITASVGPGGRNIERDVRTVQELLGRHARWLSPTRAPMVTGHYDRDTELAILRFQATAGAVKYPDGKISPTGFTIRQLSRQYISPPRHKIFTPVCWAHEGAGLTVNDFDAAARRLGCQRAASKAMTASTAAQFPDAAGAAKLDRAAQALTLSDGQTVELSSWRFEPAPGRSEARNAYRCGVQVEGNTLEVIGVGQTEALSCDGLAAVGAVSRGRIGLIYRASSPNAASVVAVVLTRNAGAWVIDERATEHLSDVSPATLAAMRRAIR